MGANVGIISIYLAKKYPFLKIYSYEPVKRNYLNLMKDLELNGIPGGTIIAENKAVTKDNRKINMNFDICNSGGSFSEEAITYRNNAYYTTSLINSITLDDIFKKYSINKLKLLKIDCEGSEYKILYKTKNLSKISFIRGEFHCPAESEEASRLLEYCKRFVSNVSVQINNS
nr:FkbM family methyltransferase [Oxalobacter aliiformigenes]